MKHFDMNLILCGESLSKEDSQSLECLNQDIMEWTISTLDNKLDQKELEKLKRAINQNTVILCFQPLVNIASLKKLLEVTNSFKYEFDSLPYIILIVDKQIMNTRTLLDSQIEYDIRDIAIIQKGMNYLRELYPLLLKRWSYYNQLGDVIHYPSTTDPQDEALKPLMSREKDTWNFQLVNQREKTLNVFVMGRPGAGKSFVINHLLGEKRCREGPGRQLTNQITHYHHRDYPIRFYDSPSFEEETYQGYLDQIYKQNNDMENGSNYIHVAIILININGRTIVGTDKELIDHFRGLNIPLYFAFTKTTNKRQVNDSIATLRNELSRMYNNQLPLDNRIFALETITEEGETQFKGLSNLLNEIGNMLKTHLIDVKLNGQTDEMQMKKSMFFSHYFKANDTNQSVNKWSIVIVLIFAMLCGVLPSFLELFWIAFILQGGMLSTRRIVFKGNDNVTYYSIIALLFIPVVYLMIAVLLELELINPKTNETLKWALLIVFAVGIGGVNILLLWNQKKHLLLIKESLKSILDDYRYAIERYQAFTINFYH